MKYQPQMELYESICLPFISFTIEVKCRRSSFLSQTLLCHYIANSTPNLIFDQNYFDWVSNTIPIRCMRFGELDQHRYIQCQFSEIRYSLDGPIFTHRNDTYQRIKINITLTMIAFNLKLPPILAGMAN